MPADASSVERSRNQETGNLAIHFGAVDGYVDVYLDGAKIGEQKKDVGFMWEKPFEIPCLPISTPPSRTASS